MVFEIDYATEKDFNTHLILKISIFWIKLLQNESSNILDDEIFSKIVFKSRFVSMGVVKE